jgi:hypothetical protein
MAEIQEPRAMTLYHPGTIEPGTDCVQCGRPGSAHPGTVHNGWCQWCIHNRMTGRTYDSYGRPWLTDPYTTY